MKKKRLIKASMLSMMAILLAACASEDIAQDKKKENGTEAPKGGVIFAANGPKVSAKRLSIDGEDEFAGAKTRTNIKHTPGNGADFYWISDDFIWVWGKDGFPHKSTHTELHDGGASAEFILHGNKADYEDGCKVWYSGQGGYALGPSAGAVAIGPIFHLNTANDFSIPSQADCGSGRAYATGNPAKFNFRLSHKASYLCFLPRCENATLSPNIRLKGIKITATNEMRFADLCMFDGEELTAPGSPFGWDFINVDLPDFKIDTKANQALNAVYMVVRPGTYNFKIEYTIEDPTTNVVGTITDVRTGITIAKDNFYDVTANLVPSEDYNPKYYMWDAVTDYWDGVSLPNVLTNGYTNSDYPQSGQPRYYNDFTLFPTEASRSCAICPNTNELLWYAQQGDPKWDTSTLWSMRGHLYKGGLWLLHRTNIPNFSSTIAPDGVTDYTKAGAPLVWYERQLTPSVPAKSEQHKYFFLPSTGYILDGQLHKVGDYADFWARTPSIHGAPIVGTHILFPSGKLTVADGCPRQYGFTIKAFD